MLGKQQEGAKPVYICFIYGRFSTWRIHPADPGLLPFHRACEFPMIDIWNTWVRVRIKLHGIPTTHVAIIAIAIVAVVYLVR